MSCDFQKLILASAAFVRVVDTPATHTDEKGEQGFSLSSPALACKHNKKGEMAQQMKLQIHNEYPYKNTTNTIKGGLITTLLLSRGLAYPTEWGKYKFKYNYKYTTNTITITQLVQIQKEGLLSPPALPWVRLHNKYLPQFPLFAPHVVMIMLEIMKWKEDIAFPVLKFVLSGNWVIEVILQLKMVYLILQIAVTPPPWLQGEWFFEITISDCIFSVTAVPNPPSLLQGG